MADQTRKQYISPRTPFYYANPLLGKGNVNIVVTGFIPQGADSFATINLANGSDFPIISIPFHLSIRPKDQELVRNSYVGGKSWSSDEERGLTSEGFPLHFGARFDLVLQCTPEGVTALINGTQAFKFAHRLDPKSINLFEVHGAIYLESVCFDFL